MMTRASNDPESTFTWPSDFERIPDRPWVHMPVDPRGLAYDAMGTHRWYRNLDLTVQQLDEHLRPGDILVDYSGGTGLLTERLLRKTRGWGVIIAEPSAGFARAALEKLRDEERVAFRLLAYQQPLKRLEWLDEALGPAMVARGVNAVVSTNAVHLYTDLAGTVQAWHRCIRPGGWAFVQSAEIQNPASKPDDLLITQYVSKLRDQVRDIVLRDARYASYRPVLEDAARMAVYEGLWRKIFLPVRPLDEYLDTLKAAGFVVEETISATVEVGVQEWYEATLVYPDLLAWIGGSDKAGDPPPTAAAIADRTALLTQARDEAFGDAITFNSCWTYITCKRP
jgi:hypothetical protein